MQLIPVLFKITSLFKPSACLDAKMFFEQCTQPPYGLFCRESRASNSLIMQAKQKSDRIGDGYIRTEEGMEPGYAMKRISEIECIRILMGSPLGTVAEDEVC
ncbi:MAG: hypothetical protein DRG87_11915 [Deltaproteobacteria bacterium]|nr:MAG: hypothetical protein DRG87_11915 [Deltaproteobacteria bacterium]